MNAERWGIVEVMGHRLLAGKLPQGESPYLSGVTVGIPMKDGTFTEEWYGQGALFSVRVVPEAVARREAEGSWHVQTVGRLLLPAVPEPALPRDEQMVRISHNALRLIIDAADGDDDLVSESVHGLVMDWLDEEVIHEDDEDLTTANGALARLAGKMKALGGVPGRTKHPAGEFDPDPGLDEIDLTEPREE